MSTRWCVGAPPLSFGNINTSSRQFHGALGSNLPNVGFRIFSIEELPNVVTVGSEPNVPPLGKEIANRFSSGRTVNAVQLALQENDDVTGIRGYQRINPETSQTRPRENNRPSAVRHVHCGTRKKRSLWQLPSGSPSLAHHNNSILRQSETEASHTSIDGQLWSAGPDIEKCHCPAPVPHDCRQ